MAAGGILNIIIVVVVVFCTPTVFLPYTHTLLAYRNDVHFFFFRKYFFFFSVISIGFLYFFLYARDRARYPVYDDSKLTVNQNRISVSGGCIATSRRFRRPLFPKTAQVRTMRCEKSKRKKRRGPFCILCASGTAEVGQWFSG